MLIDHCLLTQFKSTTKYKMIKEAFNSKGADPASEPVNAKAFKVI